MLKGRLGIEGARIPHADRHGLLWLGRGNLYVEDGTLRFKTVGTLELGAGDYGIPFQLVSCLLLEPGVTVSHDALRLCAAHGTGILAVGEGAVRLYASMPFGPDDSARARRQAALWCDEGTRVHVARRMYAWRMGEVFPSVDMNTLRGLEGARVKETYRRLAEQYGVSWHGRRYDRTSPDRDDPPNQAINHAAAAVLACAMVATAATGTIVQLGFIHEGSGVALALDIADLFRDAVTVPAAFASLQAHRGRRNDPLERIVREQLGRAARREQLVTKMIDRLKELFDVDDGGSDTQRP